MVCSSLEGWCAYLLYIAETAIDLSRFRELHEEFTERWHELKVWDCDPLSLMKYFDKELAKALPVLKAGKRVVHGFDPGHRSVSYSFDESYRWRPAFAFIRLYEQVGVPIRFSGGETLKNATEWIAPFIDFWSPVLLVIAGKKEQLTEHGFMSRTQVAVMKPDVAKSWSKWAIGALNREIFTLSNNNSMGSAQESLLEVLVEVLSRLAFKLESTDLQEMFSLALELHRQPGIASHIRLDKLCKPWFQRLFEAADDWQLLAWNCLS